MESESESGREKKVMTRRVFRVSPVMIAYMMVYTIVYRRRISGLWMRVRGSDFTFFFPFKYICTNHLHIHPPNTTAHLHCIQIISSVCFSFFFFSSCLDLELFMAFGYPAWFLHLSVCLSLNFCLHIHFCLHTHTHTYQYTGYDIFHHFLSLFHSLSYFSLYRLDIDITHTQ